MKIHTTSPKQTQKTGETFAKELKAGDIILLYGNLGAGKTTFTQGLAKGLGISKRIISPTFTIIRRYVIASEAKQSRTNNDIKTFYHIDLYRTETEEDLIGLGLPEILLEKDAIVAIEWPEKLGKFLPKKRWDIRFSDDADHTRNVSIN